MNEMNDLIFKKFVLPNIMYRPTIRAENISENNYKIEIVHRLI